MKAPLVAIVDDDEALCSSLVDIMRASSYRAEPFLSGEGLLASAKLLCFDCIIADVQMSGMDGFDLVTMLAKQNCRAPVILITALPDRLLESKASMVGAQCLLRKPFEANALLECIERTLQ